MNDKEYTYDIDKYTIGVDENGKDGIGMTVAKIENEGIKFLGNCYGENARCIDLLIKENQELKRRLEVGEEQYNDLVEEKEELQEQLSSNTLQLEKLKKQVEELDKKLFLIKNELDMRQKSIDNKLNQQQEFIKYMRELSNWYSASGVKQGLVNGILQKYKEIIGDDK